MDAIRINKKLDISNNNRIYNAEVEETDLYNKMMGDSQYEENTNTNFPELYINTRQTAISNYQHPWDLTVFQSARLIEKTLKNYGYSVDCDTYVLWGLYVNNVVKMIDKNIPSIWSTSRDTYGSHSMMVTGYKYYKLVKKVWRLNITLKKKLLFEISDGHSKSVRYFDMSAYTGLAGLVIIRGI